MKEKWLYDLSDELSIQYSEAGVAGDSAINQEKAEIIQPSNKVGDKQEEAIVIQPSVGDVSQVTGNGSVMQFLGELDKICETYQDAMSDKLTDNIATNIARLSEKHENLEYDITEGNLSIYGKYEDHTVVFEMHYVNKNHIFINIMQDAKSDGYYFALSNDNLLIQDESYDSNFKRMQDTIKGIDVSKMTIEGFEADISGYGRDYDFNLAIYVDENNVSIDGGYHEYDDTIVICPPAPIDDVAVEHALIA